MWRGHALQPLAMASDSLGKRQKTAVSITAKNLQIHDKLSAALDDESRNAAQHQRKDAAFRSRWAAGKAPESVDFGQCASTLKQFLPNLCSIPSTYMRCALPMKNSF
jgi:hypothetical protein